MAIIGGAKVSDKILIIETLLDRATDIIIGGGMAYTFMKAEGGKIGKSLCEDDRIDTATELLEKADVKRMSVFTFHPIPALPISSQQMRMFLWRPATISLMDGWVLISDLMR